MDIRTICLCRSSEYIYEEIAVNGISPTDTLAPVIPCENSDGILPFEIYELPSSSDGFSNYLCVYPLLHQLKEAYLIFGRFDNKGELVSEHRKTLDFKRAKWLSRLNYRTKRDRCYYLRDFPNDSWPTSRGFIDCSDVVSSPTHMILKGTVRLPNSVHNPRLTCITEWLNPISTAAVLFESAPQGCADHSYQYRTWQFSVRIPWNTGDVFLCSTGEQPSPDTIAYTKLSVSSRSAMISASDRRFIDIVTNAEYQNWRRFTSNNCFELDSQRTFSFDYSPLFSIVVPLYKTPRRFFEEMLASVEAQTYSNWELVLVNASPEDETLTQLIDNEAQRENRIRIVALEKNFGISLNTNKGIEAASGDFICFFDHDDVLEPNILFEYTKALNEHANIDVLYCDEDKLTPDGRLIAPAFKPDFNIDFLCYNNYICHMLTIRASLLRSLDQNTPEYDGAQDHNTVLQAAEKAREVHHIRKVLYHWRLSEHSTAGDSGQKPYANQAGIKAVQAHYDRMGIPATVFLSPRNFSYRVRYSAPEDHPPISIVIASSGNIHPLDECIASIARAAADECFEIIISTPADSSINDTLSNESFQRQGNLEIRTVHSEQNAGITQRFNQAARNSRGDYLLFLADNVLLSETFPFGHLAGACNRDDIGAVGCRLFYADDTIQHAGYYIHNGKIATYCKDMPRDRWGIFNYADAQRDVTAVSAACMMVEKHDFLSLGGFDEQYAFAYFDIDFCMKLRHQGKQALFTPEAEATRSTCVTPKSCSEINGTYPVAKLARDRASFLANWQDELQHEDPYFSELIHAARIDKPLE